MHKFNITHQPVHCLQAKFLLQEVDHPIIAFYLALDNQIFYRKRKVWLTVGNSIPVYI